MIKFVNDAIQEIFTALENWKTRTEVSIKASTNGTTYGRYDPSFGLHAGDK